MLSPSSDNNVLLSCDHVSWSPLNKPILEDISFSLFSGEILMFLGVNGSGKSSLAKILSGLLKNYIGKVYFSGKDISLLSASSLAGLICYVPQFFSSLPAFTVLEFVQLSRYIYKESYKERLFLAESALASLSISHLSFRHLPTLSGGELQLVFLASGLAQSAKLLILDEPTAYLDPAHQCDIFQEIKKLNLQHGLSFIIISHDVNQALLYSDRVLALKSGRVKFYGNSSELVSSSILQDIYSIPFNCYSSLTSSQRLMFPVF